MRHDGKFVFGLILAILFCSALACSGKKLGPDQARQLIARELQIPESQVEVRETSEMGGTVVADTSIRFAIVLQKDQTGEWKLIRVRRSDDNWLEPEAFLQSLPPVFSEALASAFLQYLNSTKE